MLLFGIATGDENWVVKKFPAEERMMIFNDSFLGTAIVVRSSLRFTLPLAATWVGRYLGPAIAMSAPDWVTWSQEARYWLPTST